MVMVTIINDDDTADGGARRLFYYPGSVVQTGAATGNLPLHTLAETTFLSLLGSIRERCEGLGLWGREVVKVEEAFYKKEIDIFVHLHPNVCHAEKKKKFHRD